MWIDQADGFTEFFKGYLPYYLLVALPILIIMSPVNPVDASHEFTVYRMQQYDLHSVPHGCRSSNINLEGRSLTSWATSRHCVVARIQDISIDQLLQIRSKSGGLLLVLPKNDTTLTQDQKEHIQLVEMAMTQNDFPSPVYLTQWSPEVEEIISDLQDSFITDDKSGTALEAMLNSVASNGYQIVVSTSNPQKVETKPITLHGKLDGRAGGTQTILITAHYDSSAVAPELSWGAESNASGAVAVLELARMFSRLYGTGTTGGSGGSGGSRAQVSLVFLLTATGPTLNYFSAKKWIEDHLDNNDDTLLQDVQFVVNLDSISSPGLVAHVSKPPKVGTPSHSIISRLGSTVHHKKINLADEMLAWQHERFSIRRMTAFTLTSLQSHKDPSRFSMLDSYSEGKVAHLVENIRRVARGLASHIYNITKEGSYDDSLLYDEALNVDESSVRFWWRYLSSQPRSPLLSTTSGPNGGGVVSSLERALSRYVSEVIVSHHAPDKREPELVAYSPTTATLNVYSVKPAVFDLILTVGIVAYLTAVYFLLQIFPTFYREYAAIVTNKAKLH